MYLTDSQPAHSTESGSFVSWVCNNSQPWSSLKSGFTQMGRLLSWPIRGITQIISRFHRNGDLRGEDLRYQHLKEISLFSSVDIRIPHSTCVIYKGKKAKLLNADLSRTDILAIYYGYELDWQDICCSTHKWALIAAKWTLRRILGLHGLEFHYDNDGDIMHISTYTDFREFVDVPYYDLTISKAKQIAWQLVHSQRTKTQ